jgi:hypothetical protein
MISEENKASSFLESNTDILKMAEFPSPKIKTRQLIHKLTKETIGNETSQGLIRIFETKYFSLKLFWILCLIGCGSLCGYLVAQTFITYLSYPVYTTTTTVHEVPTKFPKVTICNTAIAITEYAYELIKQINQEYLPNLNIFDQHSMSKLYYKDAFDKYWDINSIFLGRINSASFSDVERQKLSHSLSDILISCNFNGQLCTPSDFIWKWDPVFGNCYSFNSGFNSSGSRVDFKESFLPGTLFGLQLAVYVGYNDKLNLFNTGYFSWIPFSHSYGLNVLIENNSLSSYENHNVKVLNGGSFNFMSVKREFTSKLPKPYSDCDIDNSNTGHVDSPYFNLILNSPYQYSQDLCVTQCIQQYLIQICNCSMPNYVDLYNVSCKNNAESMCASEAPFTGKLNSSVTNCIPKCPLECNSTQITYELTSQTFAGIGYAFIANQTSSLRSDFNSSKIDEATASNKFVQLYLYYESLSFTSSVDSPSMDIVAFLGNIGGTIGLFLGISVLSVCELIHVLFESFFLLIQVNSNKLQKTK